MSRTKQTKIKRYCEQNVVHAQKILNQAAADNEKVGSDQPIQPVATKGNND